MDDSIMVLKLHGSGLVEGITPQSGTVVQVQHFESSEQHTGSTATPADIVSTTGVTFEKGITPIYADSKILVQFGLKISGTPNTGIVSTRAIQKVNGTETDIAISTLSSHNGYSGGYSGSSSQGVGYFGFMERNLQTLVDASGTVEHIFKPNWFMTNGITAYMNVTNYAVSVNQVGTGNPFDVGGVSSITLMEIKS